MRGEKESSSRQGKKGMRKKRGERDGTLEDAFELTSWVLCGRSLLLGVSRWSGERGREGERRERERRGKESF